MLKGKRRLKVFLCHAHADRNKVSELYNHLTQNGMDVWLDKKKLFPGQNWELEIRNAVYKADVVLVCLSNNFNKAGFRQKEIQWALDTAMMQPEGEIFIVPIRLEECPTPEALRKWQWVNLFENNGYEKLAKTLKKRASKIGVTTQERTIFLDSNTPERSTHTKSTLVLISMFVAVFVVLLFTVSILRIRNIFYVYVVSDISGKREIYDLSKNFQQITVTSGQAESWSPAPDANGNLYFTSNQNGKAEIYRLGTNGQVLRVTATPGEAESWSPAPAANGNLYFTSNRTGKAEIYRLETNGQVLRVTATPGDAESWSPAPTSNGNLYFTSNQDGKAEIYRLETNGQVLRVTATPGRAESWSPTSDADGNLYFTSNQDGKAEIYSLDTNGLVLRVTTTPGQAESWSPVLDGRGILYFTSNQGNSIKVFVMTDSEVYSIQSVTDAQSWTGTIDAQYLEK